MIPFIWDATKNERNIRERALDFAYATRIFEGHTVEWEDGRRDYGERRMIAIGIIDGRMYVIVYTDRVAGRHIISARRANERERRAYGALFG